MSFYRTKICMPDPSGSYDKSTKMQIGKKKLLVLLAYKTCMCIYNSHLHSLLTNNIVGNANLEIASNSRSSQVH